MNGGRKMKRVDMIVEAPHFYTMEGEGVGYLSDAAMAIDGGKIVAVGAREDIRKEYAAEEVMSKPHHMILPGFVDAHMHTDITVLRGLAQDTKYWMMYGLSPFSNVIDLDDESAGGKLGYLEAIRNGTTTFSDFNENIENTCRFVEKIGARACLTPEIRDAKFRVYEPGELYEFDRNMGEKSFNENIEIFDKWNGKANGRIKIFFGPQGADFCSQELLLKIRQAAIERKTKIHMHVQQGDRETYQIEKRYGKRPVAWLDEIGYLDENLISVHLTDCTEEEVRFVASKKSPMVACPGSIGIIDGIVPPFTAFKEAGGIVGLGSDQAPGNNCHNMINEMKLAALFSKIKYSDPEKTPAWEALRMATIDGAKVLGLDDKIGSIKEGKCADFIAVDLREYTMMPLYTKPMRNMVPNLVYAARGNEISTVVVDGKVLVEDGCLRVGDTELLKDEAQRHADDIAVRATDGFWKVNGSNATMMKEGKL